ncbi:MAG: molybdopterin molybdotransferase MoeA [Deltaproteobacteria bacterium]|jgi:molybdopterin molybdotransferase|nr:molybdopterin molybdotransferase MoeA [Deltaproteobacteria bacterium]
MFNFLTLKSVAETLALLELFEPLPATEVPLAEALGRVLAEPFLAPENLPGFDRSTVDGFAVQARDVFGASEGLPAALTLVGECPMGQAPTLVIQPGQTARIWTGGMLPQGADAVVMLEHARLSESQGLVELTRPLAPGDNVILADEDAIQGRELIPPGQTLGPPELGLLAALGQKSARVRSQPTVAILASGDEVVPLDVEPGPGQVRDINSQTIQALASLAGAKTLSLGLAPDDLPTLSALVHQAWRTAEIVVISGGSSAGQRDFTLQALQAIPGAEILAHGVAVSPGKPLIIGRAGQKSLWGLPGHPAGALVTAEIFLKPLIWRLTGAREPVWAQSLTARLSRPVVSAQGRRDYFRVSLSRPDPQGPLLATPILGKSGLITTLVGAEALAICPEELEGLEAGALVEIRLLS